MSPWPRRLAWLTVIATVPLLLLGATVTTMRVGMAVPDWPQTFGQNMFTYPWSEMVKDTGVFWEHTHRLAGAFVGLCVVITTIATFALDKRRTPRALSAAALLLVCIQGYIGGARVLENSPELAFLHGSFAQIVFATFVALAIVLAPKWGAAEQRPCKRAKNLRRYSMLAMLSVYGQIVLGAWLRHSGAHAALGLHVLMVMAVLFFVMKTAAELREAHAHGVAGGHDRSAFLGIRKRMLMLLHTQILLGVMTTVAIFVWSKGFNGFVSSGEIFFSVLHLLTGALLFCHTLAAHMWATHLLAPAKGAAPAGAGGTLSPGGAAS